jgi:hypothetical protein
MAGARPALGRRKLLALALAGMALAGGCSRGGSSEGGDESSSGGGIETPTFRADTRDGVGSMTTSADGALPSTSTPGGSTATTAGGAQAGSTTSTPGQTAQLQSVSFDDPVGDATPGIGATRPPAWTDLAGGALDRQGNAFRLTIRLGGEAPKAAPGAETMNIATFFDVDGDGAIDYELWVNLGRNGWGPTWYDDKGNAAPGERSNVTVVVEGAEVRLLFPDVMLGSPPRLRFSVASEYGPLSSIGSNAARRDDAPDNDRAISFPA